MIDFPTGAISNNRLSPVLQKNGARKTVEALLLRFYCESCFWKVGEKSQTQSLLLFVVASKRSIRRFVITEKAPTRDFSWLKAATTAFTFKTLLRHYAKWALTPRSLNVKLGPRRNYHKGWAIRHYANQPARPLWPNFTLRDRGVNVRLA